MPTLNPSSLPPTVKLMLQGTVYCLVFGFLLYIALLANRTALRDTALITLDAEPERAVSINLLPLVSSKAVGQTVTLTVQVDQRGQSIQTSDITLGYPADTLEFKHLTDVTARCTAHPSTEAGSIRLSCAAPEGVSATEQLVTLTEATFAIIKSGTAVVTVDESSVINGRSTTFAYTQKGAWITAP